MCVSVAVCVSEPPGCLSQEDPGWVHAFVPKCDGNWDLVGPRHAWEDPRRLPGLGSHREFEIGAEKTNNSCASTGLHDRDKLRGSQTL